MSDEIEKLANDLMSCQNELDKRERALQASTNNDENWRSPNTVTDKMRTAKRLWKMGKIVLNRKVKKLREALNRISDEKLKRMLRLSGGENPPHP